MEQGYQELCKTQPTILVEDFEPMKPLEEEELMEASLTTDRKQVIVGICAMKKKSFSKPMKEILNRLAEFEYLKMIVFEEELLLKLLETRQSFLVRVKIGSADSIVCRIPQNELITVDLDVSLFNGG